jgi:molybdenum cofactor synthesis domain-containing protein
LIIGDEVLNGKTKDSNSNYFAKWCFDRGIDVRRIEVIPDDEDDIVEAARRMTSKYDFVITSGGIGPTPDDITYQSIAKAFDGEPLEYHDETLRRMQENLQARRRDQGEVTEDVSCRGGIHFSRQKVRGESGRLTSVSFLTSSDDDCPQENGALSQQGYGSALRSI